MKRLAWFGMALAMVGSFGSGRGRAQDEYPLPVDVKNRVYDIRDGKRPAREAGGPEAIEQAAKYAVLRIISDVNHGMKTGTLVPMSTLVQEGARFVLEPPAAPRKLVDSQKEYVQMFGKAACANIQQVMTFAQNNPRQRNLAGINGARMLAELARSGYEGCADVAVEIASNPKETDAVRLYAFRALKNVFSAVNPEDPARSFVTSAAGEKKAIDALIAYISQKPNLPADTPADEVDAYRYVRREAVRALGAVRKPVLRDNKKIVAAPALWLLRVAVMDPAIVPAPSLSERTDALVGYLQLAPDSQQNMDYAVWFVGKGIHDLGWEFTEYLGVAGNSAKVTVPMPRDIHPWRVTANRMRAGLKDWKDNWEAENAGAPPATAKLVAELVDRTISKIFEPMAAAIIDNQRAAGGEYTKLDTWLKSQQYPSTSLFKDDPTSVITLPKLDQ